MYLHCAITRAQLFSIASGVSFTTKCIVRQADSILYKSGYSYLIEFILFNKYVNKKLFSKYAHTRFKQYPLNKCVIGYDAITIFAI